MAQIETSGDHGSVHILATSTLDSSLQAGLLSFYGLLGLTDIYWNQVHQVFDPGPGLVVVATNGNWPPKHLEPDTIRAAAFGHPFDRKTVLLSAVAIGSPHRLDVGLMAAVYQAALQRLLTLGMEKVRYEVPAHPAYFRRVLSDAGFVPEGTADAIGETDTPASGLLDSNFGGCDTHDQLISLICALQLGGPRQLPGSIADLGISPFLSSEPGTPDGGTKRS